MTGVLTSTQVLSPVQLFRLKHHSQQNLPIFILSSLSSTSPCPILSNLVPQYVEVHICVHFLGCKSFLNVWQRTWMKCEGPRQWPSDKDHMLTPTTISRVLWSVWVGHPRLELFQLVFFDLGLGLSGVLYKAKSLKTGDLVPNTPSFLAVSSQANHLNPLSPNFFFLPTYLSIHPSIHSSSTFIYYSRLC